jgi:hypothetical protein
MNTKTALKKFEKAGATITSHVMSQSEVTVYYAKFEGKKTIEFWPDPETGNVDTFAIPYAYDNGSQEILCFFRDTAKAAIECATR